jgi:hypothetical protein
LDAWLEKKKDDPPVEDDMDEEVRKILGREGHVVVEEEGGRGRIHGMLEEGGRRKEGGGRRGEGGGEKEEGRGRRGEEGGRERGE